MEDGELEQFKGQFEFHTRRAITEAAPHRAACRYDSADDNEEEELAVNGADFFDLNMLPDQMPQDLYSQNNANNNSRVGGPQGLLNFRHQQQRYDHLQNYQEPPLRLTNKNAKGITSDGLGRSDPTSNGGNQQQTNTTGNNFTIGQLGKPLKPTTFGQASQVPGKVFTSSNAPHPNSSMVGGNISGYNSQKNLRSKAEYCNQTMTNGPAGGAITTTLSYGNNRYSSQNMKRGSTSDFDEDEEQNLDQEQDDQEQLDDQENGLLDVADENCATSTNLNDCTRTADSRLRGVMGIGSGVQSYGYAQSHLQTEVAFSESAPETLSQTYRRGSYRYKDRINTIRMQSKENYQREYMIGPTYFTQINENNNDDKNNQSGIDEEITHRASNRKGKRGSAKQTGQQYQRQVKNHDEEGDDFDLFERAADNIYSQRTRYQNNFTSGNMNRGANSNYNETQINMNQNDFSELELNQHQIGGGGLKKVFKSRYDYQNVSGFCVSSTVAPEHVEKRWTHQGRTKAQTVDNEGQYGRQECNFLIQKDHEEDNNCQDDDATPKQDMSQLYVDPKSGAHFQYGELIKRLSDMTSNSSKDNMKSSSRKSNKLQKGKVKQFETDARMPLKEKTQEIVNQPHISSSQKKKKLAQSAGMDPNSKMRPYCNSAKNQKKETTKKTQQMTSHLNQHQPTQNLVSQTKISKLLLNNQENHFIDRKLKDLQSTNDNQSQQLLNQTKAANGGHLNPNLTKNLTMNHHNKSHQNLHRSIEKTFQKISSTSSGQQTQQQCQINNMKLNKASLAAAASQLKQIAQTTIIPQLQGGVNNQQLNKNSNSIAQQSIQQQQHIIINNILSSNALSSSISSSSTGNGCGGTSGTNQYAIGQQTLGSSAGGTFSSCVKCPSSNMLRTATTAAFTTTTTNKSSANKLTQCNSNKQISSTATTGNANAPLSANYNAKETPEATSRQKLRLTGTALSSTSKRNTATMNCGCNGTVTSTLGTLSNNSQGNTIQNSHSSMQTLIQQHHSQQLPCGGQYLQNAGHHSQNMGSIDSANKRSQNSEQKDVQSMTNKSHNGIMISSNGQINSGTNTHPSSVPRSNSSHKKVSVQKMIKNQSFLKGSTKGDITLNKKQANNEFYNTVLQNLQTGKLGLSTLSGGSSTSQVNINMKQQNQGTHQISNNNNQITMQAANSFQAGPFGNPNIVQPRLSDTKKQSLIGQSSKTTRVSGVGAHGNSQQLQIPLSGNLGMPIGGSYLINNGPSGLTTNPPSKPQSRLSNGKKGSDNNRVSTGNQRDSMPNSAINGGINLEGGMSQISNNIKKISDILQAHQQSPTSQNDYYSRKNSNKTLKDDEQNQQFNDKSILIGKQQQTLLNNQGANAQKFNQFFMKINQEQQQFLANQSQQQIKSNQGSSTNLNYQLQAQPQPTATQQQHHSILLTHQVNKKHTNPASSNRMTGPLSNTSSAMNTGRPFSSNSSQNHPPTQEPSNRKVQNDSKVVTTTMTNGECNQMQFGSTAYATSSQNHALNSDCSLLMMPQQNNNTSLSAYQNQQLQQTMAMSTNNTNTNTIHQDNRKSLQVQHKTLEKKVTSNNQQNQVQAPQSHSSSSQLTQQQQQYQQKLAQNQKEKRSQYLMQKKEELVQATMRSQNTQNTNRFTTNCAQNSPGQTQQIAKQQIAATSNMGISTQPNTNNQQDQSVINGKKGFLLTNIKIPKSNGQNQRQQQHQQVLMTQPVQMMMQQENAANHNNAYDRMHLPTEEDDYCNPSLLTGVLKPSLTSQIQMHNNDLNSQQVVMTEVFQLNNLMETEGGDQYDIYSSNVSSQYLATQQQKGQNMLQKASQSRYGGVGSSRHAVKVKPKHF